MQNKEQKNPMENITLKGAIIFLGFCVLLGSCVIANKYNAVHTSPSNEMINKKLDQIIEIVSKKTP